MTIIIIIISTTTTTTTIIIMVMVMMRAVITGTGFCTLNLTWLFRPLLGFKGVFYILV